MHHIPAVPKTESRRVRVGVALSGGSARSIAHIGVLEVLVENRIPIDYISACSSGSIVAASFACGTLADLREDWLRITKEQWLSWIEPNGTSEGLFNLKKAESWFRTYTLNKHFEDVRPLLGFVAADVENGEEVLLQMGDLARAIRVSCSVPGMFEPVRWGNKTLVDGGLLNIIPSDAVQRMGADIVIGVDIAAAPYIFGGQLWLLHFWKYYRTFRKSLFVSLLRRLSKTMRDQTKELLPEWYDPYEEHSVAYETPPHWFRVFAKSLDTVVDKKYGAHQERTASPHLIRIEPKVKHLGATAFSSLEFCYHEGRRATQKALPAIRSLLQQQEEHFERHRILEPQTVRSDG